MNAAARFEFDFVAEKAVIRRASTADATARTLPSPEQVAAAYQRTARICAAHASLMRAIW